MVRIEGRHCVHLVLSDRGTSNKGISNIPIPWPLLYSFSRTWLGGWEAILLSSSKTVLSQIGISIVLSYLVSSWKWGVSNLQGSCPVLEEVFLQTLWVSCYSSNAKLNSRHKYAIINFPLPLKISLLSHWNASNLLKLCDLNDTFSNPFREVENRRNIPNFKLF